MKLLFISLLTLASFLMSEAATIKDLQGWTVEGDVKTDPDKLSPSGVASIKVGPKSMAILKLRDADGSGKVSFFVYDDGVVASPDKKKAVGPRWGTSESNGRVLVGGIMYARFLQPEGSLCLVDTDPAQKDAWLAVKFIGQRGVPGWKKWEFTYSPESGLQITFDGKPIPAKYFNWNESKVSGFNGIILYGDESATGAPQTVWVGDIEYDLGPPMQVKPGSLPTPTPTPLPLPKGPAPEEETEKSTEPPVLGKMSGFTPGARLLDDLKNLKIPLAPGYLNAHPRLLFSPGDREALQKKAMENPILWDRVLASANRIKSLAGVPDAAAIRTGGKYWRVEQVQSAALAWFITGDASYRDGAIRWLVAHSREPLWGDVYRPNLDLVASWYLYHLAIAYDILRNELSEEDRKLVRDGLANHARIMYLDMDPHETKEKIRYEQNHTYIPMVALTSAALTLIDEVPDAKHWLTRSYSILRRSRYALSEDGYYYEGIGYWTYALHWHVRGAEMLERATGEKLFDLPVLKDTWRMGLYLSLPGTPKAFDGGDTNTWASSKRVDIASTNTAMLWKIASETGSAESRLVGDIFAEDQPETAYPASAFLWYDPSIKPASLSDVEPYHYFADQGIVSWRSSWQKDATCYLFRCGPPLGHKATAKFGQMQDWMMNGGHVHPDIGAFWMFAKGTYLAVGTGYTAEKWTQDHNTILIDGKGQGMDGAYHNERGIPYSDFDAARIDRHFLSSDYGFASGEFGRVYNRQVKGVNVRRSLLMTERWMLVIDDMSADAPHSYTWLCHSDAPFEQDGSAYISKQSKASLAVFPLKPAQSTIEPTATTVMAGKAPVRGTPEQRGYKLTIKSAPEKQMRFVNVLLPLNSGEQPPKVEQIQDENNIITLKILWAAGKVETARLDLNWKDAQSGPAVISIEK